MPSTAVVAWLLSCCGIGLGSIRDSPSLAQILVLVSWRLFIEKRLARKETEGAPALISQKFIKVVNIQGSQINLSCLGVEKA